jgi:arylsulfatase
VPAFVRWPGTFQAGAILNGIVNHQDWLPTFLAAAGITDIKERLLHGHDAGDQHFQVHLDGYNMLPYLSGQSTESPRQEMFYVDDDGQLVAVRWNDWKIVFMEQRAKTLQLWAEPFVPLRVPKIFNLRRDPFERADENSNTYWDWVLDHAFILVPVQAYVREMMESLKSFPPRQKPAAVNLDRVMEELTVGGVSSH